MELDYKKLAEEMIKQMPGFNSPVTLTEFSEQIISYSENNRAKKTCEGVKLVCKKVLNYFPPNRRLESIQLKDAENFLDSMRKDAPKGIYNYHRTLKAMWNKGKEWNYLRENPFEKVKLKRRQQQKPVYVNEKQLEEIIKHIDSGVVRDAVVTAFYSGCRLGEIVNLTWQDVKLKDDLLIIGNKDFETKGRKQRPVPIHNKVKEILAKRFPKIVKIDPSTPLRVKGYVFSKNNGYPFTGDYFSRRFKRACRQAGIEEEIHFHSIRHGAATKMVMNGAPLPTVQRLLGHANIQTTMIYAHPNLEDLREAVAKL